MEKVVLIKATFGEDIGKLFEEMVKQSQKSKSDVFGLFNGVLYVAFRGIKTADEVEKYN